MLGRTASLRRAVLPGICLCACFAFPGPTGAQAPVPDAYEPNDDAQSATTMEPDTRYVATISGPGDSDWFAVRRDAPSWREAAAKGRVNVSAVRLQEGCAERSLRVTRYDERGEIVTSTPVYPGGEVSVHELDANAPGVVYLRVDTALDPGCTQPIRYAIGAYPYAPVPEPRAVGSSAPNYKPTRAACRVYAKKALAISKALRHPVTSKRRAKLKRDLKVAKRRRNAACG